VKDGIVDIIHSPEFSSQFLCAYSKRLGMTVYLQPQKTTIDKKNNIVIINLPNSTNNNKFRQKG